MRILTIVKKGIDVRHKQINMNLKVLDVMVPQMKVTVLSPYYEPYQL